MDTSWPEIPFPAWRETCSALHLYCQIVGKYRLARTPWVNHSWHATLYVNARGLTTSLIPAAIARMNSFRTARSSFCSWTKLVNFSRFHGLFPVSSEGRHPSVASLGSGRPVAAPG